MNGAQTVAWIALVYLAVPLGAYLVYILFKRMRRGSKEDGEGDTET